MTDTGDGANPAGGLVMDGSGNLYGTTVAGGACGLTGGCGTVFKLDTSGRETVLHTFADSPDGSGPYAGLVRDAAGNLYGTTYTHGAYGQGAVFRLCCAVVDTTPPVTVASLNPPPNGNGWDRSNVTLTLTSTDTEPGGTGVKEIQFSATGAQAAPLQTVSGSTADLSITKEGITTVTYFATDNAGNVEMPKMITVRLDKTPPVITGMPAPGCTLWPPDNKLVRVATVAASDAPSGLAPGFKVTGASNQPVPREDIVITPSGSGEFTVQLRAARAGNLSNRVYTITADATDLAGNRATITSTCTVPHDQGN
jgi:uncharacterized repeat protein (TIGR03803 family)